MHDLQFEATVAQIRGFDLGDDEQLLAHLDGRMADGLSGAQWLLRGVLMFRAGRHDDALDCLEEAVDKGHAPSRVLYIKSCVLREHGSMGEALEVLEEAREAARSDGLMSMADLAHAQGLLFWRVGNHKDALQWVEQAVELDEHSASRWLHRGQLLALLGRLDQAERALSRALREEQDLDTAMVERAALDVGRGELSGAGQWLRKAIRLRPEVREQARTDPRFGSLRDHPEFRELLSSPGAPSLAWLDGLDRRISALREDPRLASLELSWLGEEQSEQLGRSLRADYERGPLGTMHTPATLARSRDLLTHRRAVARGPATPTREGVLEHSLLFIDRLRPQDGLWLALSPSYPPFLWIQVEPEAKALSAVLAEYYPCPRRSRLDMSRLARGFLGYRAGFVVPSPYTGGVEPATLAGLDRHFAINPFVESESWGSAYADDPWPDRIPSQPGVVHKIAEHQRFVSRQAPGHIWSLTRRTRHSRSYLTIEVHHRDIFVAELRYQPSNTPEVIQAMNDHFGCGYPTDMPVDAVAALLGFQFDGARDLEAELPGATDPEQIAGLLLVLSALRHGDLGALELYRRYVDHPASVVRSTVGDIAVAHNLEVLLEEMSIREPDVQLRAEIESLLDEGISAVEEDPYLADQEVDVVQLDDAELEEIGPLVSRGGNPS